MTESITPEPIQEPVSVDDNASTLSVDDGAGTLTVDNAALSVTGGGVEASALRVTVASDSTGVLSVDDNAGSLTVDNATISVVGGGTEATAQRVTIANDSTGVLSVDDNGGALTVDGTVTANAGTGNFTVIGSVAHDTASPGNPVMSGASHETADDSAPTNRLASITDGDVTRLSATDGALFVIPSGPQQWKARIVNNVTADTTVKAAPAAGLSLYITDVVFSIGAATASSVMLEQSTTTPVFGPHYLEAVNGRGVAVHLGTPIKIAAATLLSCTNTGATTNTLDVYGFTAPG